METEISELKKAFEDDSDFGSQFVFIVVNKKTPVRLFYSSHSSSSSNPPPGTVVDHSITRQLPASVDSKEKRYSFYLISQHVRQGVSFIFYFETNFESHKSVAPTCYTVLADNSTLSVDQIEQLTFKLCHLYYK